MKNKKTKKYIASIFIILITITMSLSGCGNGNTNDGKDTATSKTTPTAVQSDEITTTAAITTDEAVTSKDSISEDKSNDKKNDEKSSTKESKNSSSTSSSSSKNSNTDSKKNNESKSQNDKNIKCTISIDCQTLYKKDPSMASKVSTNGVILSKKTVTLKKNATVYDALVASDISFSGKSYISMINGLSEKDGGKLSGWIFIVNGETSSYSCVDHKLNNGDNVQWRYTCNGGDDV